MRGFESALNTVAGRTSLEILGTSGVDENLLRDLGWLREFGAISPVIEGEMAIAPAPGTTGVPARGEVPRRPARRSEAVKVLGVDILRDLTLRDYAVGERDSLRQSASATDAMTSQQFLELLTSPRSIVITEKMARRRGYALGGEIRLMAGDRVNTLVIRGLLKDEGPARVMDGSFVLMDIAAAQLAFDRLGRVDRVDVQLRAPEASRRLLPTSTHRWLPLPHDCLPGSRRSGRGGAASRSSGCSRRFTSTSRRCRGWRWSSGSFSSTTP